MHVCHLYRNRDQLVEALVPYFVVGLRGHERGFWRTGPPVPWRVACQALRATGVEGRYPGGCAWATTVFASPEYELPQAGRLVDDALGPCSESADEVLRSHNFAWLNVGWQWAAIP
jgi:hypothetical protein